MSIAADAPGTIIKLRRSGILIDGSGEFASIGTMIVSQESGMGLPHSMTSRKEGRVIGRDSVVECRSPMPLCDYYCCIYKPGHNSGSPNRSRNPHCDHGPTLNSVRAIERCLRF
jgi:hypothetical protein